jgi:pimeloyl-ACP methyl ester carboxylesterase
VPLPPGVSGSSVSDRAAGQQVLYLHGFASSSRSTKARFFADELERHGVGLRCPDFNEPDFTSMTMTRMLGQLGNEIGSLPGGPVTLIGSSLGGTLAILAADRWPRVDRLVLLAPAVMFSKPGHHLLPPERIEAWRHDGSMVFFHHAYGEERQLDVAFYDDSLRYDPMVATVRQPSIVFQGIRDAAVDYRTVEQFAATRPNVTLSLLDDDHSLVESLPRIWRQVQPFLDLA